LKLLAKFNIILLVIFGAGGLLIAHFAYNFLVGNARREVLEEARLMLASAKAVRDYTQDDLSPLLEQNPEHSVHFLAETVPTFAATSTFDKLREKYPDYTYREAALNPTNLKDLANGWESELIVGLRSHPEQQQVVGERETAMGRQLFIAHPITPDQGCLECHGVASAAPKSMLNVYGPVHGFGWKKNDVVGAQIISVPMSLPIHIADKAFDELIVFLVVTLIVTMAALDLGVYWFVIRPLRLVSNMADRVSRGEKDVNLVVVTGRDEIATVTQSFNRMQMSLAKAFRMLEE
jgi:methyl-accepting chemotaxis protein